MTTVIIGRLFARVVRRLVVQGFRAVRVVRPAAGVVYRGSGAANGPQPSQIVQARRVIRKPGGELHQRAWVGQAIAVHSQKKPRPTVVTWRGHSAERAELQRPIAPVDVNRVHSRLAGRDPNPNPTDVSSQLGLAAFFLVPGAWFVIQGFSRTAAGVSRRSVTLTGGEAGLGLICLALGFLIGMSAWSTRRHLGAPISYWAALQHRWRPRILGTGTLIGLCFSLFGALCCAAGLSFLGGVLLGTGLPCAAIAVAMVTGGIKPTF